MKRSVYFVASMDLGRVKIGKAEDLDARVRGLRASCPDPLLLVGHIVGYTNVERWLHERCAVDRLHGEWFLAESTTITTIEVVQHLGPNAAKQLCPAALAKDKAIANPPKITQAFINEILGRYEHGETVGAIAERFPGIDPRKIGRIVMESKARSPSPLTLSLRPFALRRYRGVTQLVKR